MSVRSDPRPGAKLAGYRIEALLGRGGMGDVYRAVDSRLGRRVALKLLAPDLAGDSRFRERFLRESQLAASLDHANVIPIYEAGEADGLLYLAMRFVDGTDLRRLLHDEGQLDARRALYLLGRVADALDAAHARGLVHRDVKPANILIAIDPKADPPEHPYLADFGLTMQRSSDPGLPPTGRFVGSADYAAPEQITRELVGPPADQYALCCVVFECLTGTVPYGGDSLMAALWAHVNDPPPRASERNPELPPVLDPVFARGLAKQPTKRYESCRELVAAARRALGLSAELPVQVAGPRRLLGRRELLLGAGAAALAATVAIPALLLTRGEGTPALAPRRSIARIDASSNSVTRVYESLPEPWTLASGDGWVWSLSRAEVYGVRGQNGVTRIDPDTGETRFFSLPGLLGWVAAGEGAVWVTTSFEGHGYLLMLDPATGDVQARHELPSSDPLAVAVTGGSVWVAAYDSLRSRTTILQYPSRPRLQDIAAPISQIDTDLPWWTTLNDWFSVEDGLVTILTWTPGTFNPTLRRFDAGTGKEVSATRFAGRPEAFTVTADAVWVTAETEPRVWRLDVAAGEVATVEWGGLDTGPITFAYGSIWLGDVRENTLTRLDPATGEGLATIQIAEPQPPGRAGPPYPFFATAPHLTGLVADDTALWAQIGGAPGNVI